ncbi:MAG TPA: DUF1801 domain-containing protein [Candidatus Limnocylindria bacterium]|jgi:hypothetical protein
MADTKRTRRDDSSTQQWTEEEVAAMQQRSKELKAAKSGKVDGETEVQAKIAEMPPDDQAMATRVHAIVLEAAPEMTTRLWYGMPAYYKDGKLICFFQPASKFKARYSTFGFEANANLDDGTMWATSWAITKLTPADEEQIKKLVKQAVS